MEKEQIVKALECCLVQEANCPECPYTGTYPECQGYVGNQALSLILEQEKRIEELENICESYALQYGTAVAKEVFLKKERADTVRKFAKRLKAKAMDVDMDDATLWLSCVPVDDIDQIAKELLEEGKNNAE